MIILVGGGCSCASKYVTNEKGIGSQILKSMIEALSYLGVLVVLLFISYHSKHKIVWSKLLGNISGVLGALFESMLHMKGS